MALQPLVTAVEQDVAGTPPHAALVSAAQVLVPRALKSSATVQAPSWSTVAKADEMSRPSTPVGPRTNFVLPSRLQARRTSAGRSSPVGPPVPVPRPHVSAPNAFCTRASAAPAGNSIRTECAGLLTPRVAGASSR